MRRRDNSTVRFKCVRIRFITMMIGLAGSLQAQHYPAWFLDPTLIHCTQAFGGIAEKSYLLDSAVNYAKVNGLIQQNINRGVNVEAETSYWGTEAGKYCLWKSYEETPCIKTIERQNFQKEERKVFTNESLVFVLSLDSTCEILESSFQSIEISKISSPSWVEHVPELPTYWYAVGIAPKYYYETSSWWQSEREARKYLAFSKGLSIRDMTKVSGSGESQQVLNVNVELRYIEVVARWRDLKNELFYCLLRCPRQ